MISADLIIIGAGPGGYSTAAYAAKKGLKVIIVEKGFLGGTCLNSGCIPTKCLAHDADLLRNPLLRQAGNLEVDFKQIMNRKHDVIAKLREGVSILLSHPNITLVNGQASFIDERTLSVDRQALPVDEQASPADKELISAPHIIIATGSNAKLPKFAIDGMSSETTKVVTSTELLQLEQLPKRLAIVGAGVIGMEFASAFNAFGSHVEVYEFLKECLPTLDKDIAKRLRKTLEKRGIGFHMKYSVQSVEELNADVVLIATGRSANTGNLGLEKAGIAYDGKGITVDDNMETNVKGIYAIGDVNGRMMLAHAAEWQGRRAVNHILGESDNIRLDIMPSAIFTYPEAASVGPTEEKLKADNMEFTTHKSFYRANGKALAIDETEGMLKLLTDKAGKIIACHVYGAHAADIVQEVAALMNMDITIDRLADIVHIHPTLSEIIIDAAN